MLPFTLTKEGRNPARRRPHCLGSRSPPRSLFLFLSFVLACQNSWPPVPQPSLPPVVPAYRACYGFHSRVERSAVNVTVPSSHPGAPFFKLAGDRPHLSLRNDVSARSLWRQSPTVDPSPLSPFKINTCISVENKRLYPPLESTLIKTRGGGRGSQKN